MLIKAAGFEFEIDRISGDYRRWYVNLLRETETTCIETEIVVSQNKLEEMVCGLILELGLTKRIQAAIKPLLLDAAHATSDD